MSEAHKQDDEESPQLAHDESNWLVSYADMMTLLFGFFVLMYAMSRIDNDKFEVVSKEMAQYFGGKIKEDAGTAVLREDLQKLLVHAFTNPETPPDEMAFSGSAKKETPGDRPFELNSKDGQLMLKFKGAYLFNPGSAQLKPEMQELMSKLAIQLHNTKRVAEITVEGHTDDSPINSSVFPTNWELSAARASRIVRQFESSGMESQKLIAKGLSSSRPELPNRNEKGEVLKENQAANRRVVIFVKLTPEKATSLSNELNQYLEPMALKEVPEVKKQVSDQGTAAEGLTSEEVEVRLKEAQEKLNQAQKDLRVAEEDRKKKEKLLELEKKIDVMNQKTDEARRKAEELGRPKLQAPTVKKQ